KFKKAIEDDHNSYVETSSGRTSSQPMGLVAAMTKIRNLPNSANPSAMLADNDAREAAQRGDLQGALTAFSHAVELDPKFTRDWLMLGSLQMNSRDPDTALETLHKAVDSDPTQVLPLRVLGYALVQLKKYDEAVTTLQKIIKIDPEDAEAPWNLGTVLVAMKRYPGAAAAYESALKLNPDQPRLEMGLGDAYLQAGDEANALVAYKKTLELSSEPLMLNDIGYALADANKQLPLALQYAERAVREEE